jgi:hypothetical protein
MTFDWPLVARYALLCALCGLIPVPLVDGWVEDRLRRRLVRRLFAARGQRPSDADASMLADAAPVGCLGIIKKLVLWPFKKLLSTILFVLQLDSMANTFSDVVHRALLVHEALDRGDLPGDAVRVRAAMNRAMVGVDLRPARRAVAAAWTWSRGQAGQVLLSLRARMRGEANSERAHEPVSADAAPLAGAAEQVSVALAEAVRVPGLADELIRRYQSEIEAT